MQSQSLALGTETNRPGHDFTGVGVLTRVSRAGSDGGSQSRKDESHGGTEEVSGGAAGASDPDGGGACGVTRRPGPGHASGSVTSSGSTPRRCVTGSSRPRSTTATGRARRPLRRSGSPSWSGRTGAAAGERDPADARRRFSRGGARPPDMRVIVEYIDEHRDRVRGRADLQTLTDAGCRSPRAPTTPPRTSPPSARSVTDAATTGRDPGRCTATTTACTASGRSTPSCTGRATAVARCTVAAVDESRRPAGDHPGEGTADHDPRHRTGHPPGPGRQRPSPPPRRTSCGSRTSPTAAPSPAGSTPRSSSTSSPGASSAGSSRPACAPTWPWTPSRWACGTQAPRRPRHHRPDPALGQGRAVRRRALHPAPRRGRRGRVGRLDRQLLRL